MTELILMGFLGGVLGGAGLGGGTVLIPLLTLLLSFDQKTAQWINVASFIPMSIIALAIHFKNKLIEVKPLLFMSSALPCAALFALLSSRAPSPFLQKCFGVFLIAFGIGGIVKVFKKKKILPKIPCDE